MKNLLVVCAALAVAACASGERAPDAHVKFFIEVLDCDVFRTVDLEDADELQVSRSLELIFKCLLHLRG
jgi:hypothetical protein